MLAVLLSDRSITDDAINGVIHSAIERGIPILPITIEEGMKNIEGQLPEMISHINVSCWKGQGNTVVTSLLENLGLVEKERKLFISYRRQDTSEIAELTAYKVDSAQIRRILG